MSKCPPTFFLPALCLWQWLWESVSDCPVTVIVFASIFSCLLGREKSQPEAAESRLRVYGMPMLPTKSFLAGETLASFGGEIGGNEQPRVRGEPFQAHGEVAAVRGSECSGVTVRNQLYFGGWRVCLWGDWLTEMAGSQFWERFQT